MLNSSWDCMKSPGVARRPRCGLRHCDTCDSSQEQASRLTEQPQDAEAVKAAHRAFDNAFCAGETTYRAVEEAIKNYKAYADNYQPVDSSILDDLDAIRNVAGDIDIGYFQNSEGIVKKRGNVGGIVSRACDRIESTWKIRPPEREAGELDKDVQIELWRKLANAKPKVFWRRGFPSEGGMYLVRLADGEMCVTPWNDGTGTNKDSWGEDRKTGWCCLTDSRSTVKGWISVADLRTLAVEPLIEEQGRRGRDD